METPNSNPTATPATPETTPAPEATPAPTETKLYAGKYKSVEEMEAGYKALESRLGAPKETPAETPAPTETPAEATPTETPATETPTPQPTTEEAKNVLSQAGIDFDALSKEYLDNGGLTQESIDKLNKAGFPKDVVDNYVAGAEAQAKAVLDDLYSTTGGEEGFQAMLEWGGANMNEAEINAFNAAMHSSDIEQAKLAIAGVKARMGAAGTEPKLLTPTNTNNVPKTSGGYSNQSEMMDAINARDDRGRQKYGNDPAYTKEVEAKIKASTFL